MGRRITVVLDDDLRERLRAESQIRGETFQATMNKVVRDGLAVAERHRAGATAFRVKARMIGLKAGLSYDSVSRLLEVGEGEDVR